MNGSKPSGNESAGNNNSGLTSSGSNGNMQSSQKPKWTKEEQEKPFDYWELQDDKNGFPRHLKAAKFSGDLERHYSEHGTSVGAKDSAEYTAKALNFLNGPRGEFGDAAVRRNGDAARYDYHTHEFAVMTKTGVIKTYWNLAERRSSANADLYWRNYKNGN